MLWDRTRDGGDRLLVSAREAAHMLGISQRMLYAMRKTGQLPCVRIGTRVLFSVAALRQWIEQQQQLGQ
jgi:excisionase family DNA binding protein